MVAAKYYNVETFTQIAHIENRSAYVTNRTQKRTTATKNESLK